MDRFRIVAVSLTVALDVPDQVTAFVVGVPAHPFRHAHAIDDTDRKLHTEFRLGCRLASNDRSDMWLADAHQTVTDAFAAGAVR